MGIYCVHPPTLGIVRIMAEKTIETRSWGARILLVTITTVYVCIYVFRIWNGDDFIHEKLLVGWRKGQ